ncbi:ORF6N domain-containing protein [Flavobacterium sinopsychrotolerans]|uniref:ORF6N domain-containing protein n=1 Tax=Flavobacterium sinopsychrotolerans TaxID=604089 RepID=A0A1H8PX81_9FLAO|nr:ORF6N domain-containing protein [Flavobacterium sinopsychrotolerans]SEO46371.1 ORF6N domain-containing protein [Flavobacterium sinopsychrotolerans]
MQIHTLQSKIHDVQGQKVILDFDLAVLYEVETKVLNQAVKRNIKRFPVDFMFRLNIEEWESMRSQIVTAYQNKRNVTVTPFAFTEQGIAMLSGILNSDVAIHVNIAIMRTFVIIRKYALEHKEFNEKLLEIETKYDKKFNDIYEALNYLIKKDEKDNTQKDRKQIGYKK